MAVLSYAFSVFAGVGERTREGNDLYREMIENGVIKLGDKQVSYVRGPPWYRISKRLAQNVWCV